MFLQHIINISQLKFVPYYIMIHEKEINYLYTILTISRTKIALIHSIKLNKLVASKIVKVEYNISDFIKYLNFRKDYCTFPSIDPSTTIY